MERSFSGHEWEKSNSEDENEFLSLGNPEKFLFKKNSQRRILLDLF